MLMISQFPIRKENSTVKTETFGIGNVSDLSDPIFILFLYNGPPSTSHHRDQISTLIFNCASKSKPACPAPGVSPKQRANCAAITLLH